MIDGWVRLMEYEESKIAAPEVAQTIYNILSNFFFDLETYWIIQEHYRAQELSDPTRPIWILLSNNCLQMAVVEWCKVFGSPQNNKTHYTKCIDPLEGIENTVKEMKEFRDKYISHYDSYDKPVPFLYKAIEIVDMFDDCMLDKYETNNVIKTTDYMNRVYKDIQQRLLTIISNKG